MKVTDKYTFFWKTADVFSQWHPSEFTDTLMNIPERFGLPGFKFKNTEQYMMFSKADMFHDEVMARKILMTDNARDIKAFGRLVRNFNSNEWDAVKYAIVKKGNFLKFDQNPSMKKQLLSTGNTTLVEASPYDTIWGIGLYEGDPRAMDDKQWLGENLLGKLLIELRNEFRK